MRSDPLPGYLANDGTGGRAGGRVRGTWGEWARGTLGGGGTWAQELAVAISLKMGECSFCFHFLGGVFSVPVLFLHE